MVNALFDRVLLMPVVGASGIVVGRSTWWDVEKLT
jgi:hypothetical protein